MSIRPLLVLLVFAVAIGAGLWFAFANEPAPPPPSTTTPGSAAPADAPAPTAVGEVPALGAGAVGAERQAVELPAGAASAGPERAIVGRVVDDAGLPVGGASVAAWLGGADAEGRGADWRDRLQNMGPNGLAELVQRNQQQRVEVETAVDGSFRLVVRGVARSQPLRVRAVGHRLLDRTVAVPRDASGDVDAGTLQLERGAVIRGRVLGPGGAPVAMARVAPIAGGVGGRGGPFAGAFNGDFDIPGADAFADFAGDGAQSGADGSFELAHVAPGELSLRASHPDHPRATRDGLRVAAGAVLADVVIQLEAGASIAGRVVDIPAGATGLRVMAAAMTAPAANRPEPAQGRPGAEFFGGMMNDFAEQAGDAGLVGERTAELGADGTFELRGLRGGRGYRLWAVQQGRGLMDVSVCTQRLEVTPPIAAIELRYDAGLRVTFVVQDARTGKPVETLWVEDRLRGGSGIEAMMGMVPRNTRSRVYPAGRVELGGLRPKPKQTLSLTIAALGYGKLARADLVVPERGELDLGVLQLEPAPVLRVVVTAIDGSTPIADANVRVRVREERQRGGNPFGQLMAGGDFDAGPLAARTDENGRCVVNLQVGAEVQIGVEHRDFAPFRSEAFTVKDATDLDLPVPLRRGGVVVVLVKDSAGKPMAKASVERAGSIGGRDQKATDAAGNVTFERLAPGEHRFRLATGGGGRDFTEMAARLGGGAGGELPSGPEWQPVVVVDGETARLELQQAATAALRGVVREQGKPVAGARINFVSGDGSDDRGGDVGRLMAEFGGGNRSRSARSGDDGSFELKNLPAGNHRLRITASARAMPTVVPIGLGFGDNSVDIALERTVVRGVVRGPDGAPVAGASISIGVVPKPAAATEDPMLSAFEGMLPGGVEMMGGGGGRSVKSGDDGTFELVGVQAGEPLRVRATAKGLAAASSEPFQLAPDDVRDGLVLQLGAAGKIDVTGNGSGLGASLARARRLDATGQPDAAVSPVTQALRRGRGTLEGLQPGRWRVELVQLPPTGEAPPSRDVEVVAGQTAAIVF